MAGPAPRSCSRRCAVLRGLRLTTGIRVDVPGQGVGGAAAGRAGGERDRGVHQPAAAARRRTRRSMRPPGSAPNRCTAPRRCRKPAQGDTPRVWVVPTPDDFTRSWWCSGLRAQPRVRAFAGVRESAHLAGGIARPSWLRGAGLAQGGPDSIFSQQFSEFRRAARPAGLLQRQRRHRPTAERHQINAPLNAQLGGYRVMPIKADTRPFAGIRRYLNVRGRTPKQSRAAPSRNALAHLRSGRTPPRVWKPSLALAARARPKTTENRAFMQVGPSCRRSAPTSRS